MIKCKYDKLDWEYDYLIKPDDVLDKVHQLSLLPTKWGFRGQPGEYANLNSSFERLFEGVEFQKEKEREIKIGFEIQSVELFRRTLVANKIEIEESTKSGYFYTLAILQHYNGKTRLLDWSLSPYVALYFAVGKDDDSCGEIWSFEYDQYEKMAARQWIQYPNMGHNDFVNAFLDKSDDDWFVCQFYPRDTFPRIFSQNGFFSMTSQFSRDQAKVIPKLFEDKKTFHLYVISKNCKSKLRRYLREKLNIWGGSIYPDLTGSGEGIKEVLIDDTSTLPRTIKRFKKRYFSFYGK